MSTLSVMSTVIVSAVSLMSGTLAVLMICSERAQRLQCAAHGVQVTDGEWWETRRMPHKQVHIAVGQEQFGGTRADRPHFRRRVQCVDDGGEARQYGAALAVKSC